MSNFWAGLSKLTQQAPVYRWTRDLTNKIHIICRHGFRPMKESSCSQSYPNNIPHCSKAGFTLVELILIIVLLGIVSITAIVKWPSGLDDKAATMEMKRAIRYAQHMAMTREYTTSTPWGINIDSNKYSIKSSDTETASAEFINRYLLGNSTNTISPSTSMYFNGLGEPIQTDGTPLTSSTTYTINGSNELTVCPETGYVAEGPSCP